MTDIIAFQEGREARIDGKPRDGRRNADWLHGWDTVDMQERPLKECGLNDRIECHDCDGSGFTMLTRCCGYALPNGECCGNGTDDKEPCEFCHGEGWRAVEYFDGQGVESDEEFCAAVWEALKGDHSDLRRQQIILKAHRKAIAKAHGA